MLLIFPARNCSISSLSGASSFSSTKSKCCMHSATNSDNSRQGRRHEQEVSILGPQCMCKHTSSAANQALNWGHVPSQTKAELIWTCSVQQDVPTTNCTYAIPLFSHTGAGGAACLLCMLGAVCFHSDIIGSALAGIHSPVQRR
jgi:hypothetical protein